MNGWMKKMGLGVALAASAMTVAAPAEAQRYRGGYYRGYHGGYYHRGGNGLAAGAVLGGILGLGVGAAIASSNRGPYYDRGYYETYAPPPPPPRVVERDYYYDGYPAYAPRCYSQWRFDPYYGRQVQVRVCN